MLKKGKTKKVKVNKAERDAVSQVLNAAASGRISGLDEYERDLLQQLLDKIDS